MGFSLIYSLRCCGRSKFEEIFGWGGAKYVGIGRRLFGLDICGGINPDGFISGGVGGVCLIQGSH